MSLIKINSDHWIDEAELKFSFIRSSGPGGQNVNKVSTAVQLSFDIYHSKSLNPDIRKRLIEIAGNKVTNNGLLILKSDKYRSQLGNRNDVLKKFKELISRSLIVPSERKKTKPSKKSVESRLYKKKLIGQKKKTREKIKSFE
ncbi:MAG: aminoacyl-tRNA hydrolase [Candidatus Dadabacteria bacterium]|nr:aminoacyl-tRNA hydrolase [Candidatus Dadabacteria bacterium]NIQ16519.1 aminoacyl-tRNA hydrolase [Candidatus Dadabacteria bacterium]